jgi:small-conductance mechanosensitive channel
MSESVAELQAQIAKLENRVSQLTSANTDLRDHIKAVEARSTEEISDGAGKVQLLRDALSRVARLPKAKVAERINMSDQSAAGRAYIEASCYSLMQLHEEIAVIVNSTLLSTQTESSNG